ncbi:doublesex- and mab-3-related transcription factor A2 [Platysternon megacephalum]|uniref:Doublesex-and mab-3-related transcription factor A2 n=1 Tax=Platysternon megacephalum TaxID=55544 RepID=A0A4D9EHM9_9SAUR|nr:doublesex- and mab-3-related transcription factor A2 [Platysternon megacephalum]
MGTTHAAQHAGHTSFPPEPGGVRGSIAAPLQRGTWRGLSAPRAPFTGRSQELFPSPPQASQAACWNRGQEMQEMKLNSPGPKGSQMCLKEQPALTLEQGVFRNCRWDGKGGPSRSQSRPERCTSRARFPSLVEFTLAPLSRIAPPGRTPERQGLGPSSQDSQSQAESRSAGWLSLLL